MADTFITDTCLYLEANAGDGGVHNMAGVWWLSPDILLNDPALTSPAPPAGTTPGTAQQNPGPNAVGVRVHQKSGCTAPKAGTPPKALVELWVCDPSAIVPSSAHFVNGGTIGLPLTPTGSIKQFGNWIASANAADPDGPGHKCMVARVYPQNDGFDSTQFHVVDPDQHYAQHNICIQPCPMKMMEKAMGGAGTGLGGHDQLLADTDGLHKFRLLTVNHGKRPAVAVLSVRTSLKPPQHAIKAATPALRRLKVAPRPITEPPRRTGLQVNQITRLDSTRVGRGTKRPANFWNGKALVPLKPTSQPTATRKLTLQPRQQVALIAAVDLEGLPRRRPLFVDVVHRNSKGRVLGGCTIVFVPE
jgi:hypothetical protein